MNLSMDIKKKGTRNIASNTVMIDGRNLGRYVVVLDGDVVDSFFPLTCELPFTEWRFCSIQTLQVLSVCSDNVNRCCPYASVM